MNREKAIEILRKNRPTSDPRPCGVELCDAVDMAISAIRQQDVADKDVGKNETLTNAQKIRSMSDDELAKLLCCTGWRMIEQKECLEWLQMPAGEEGKHEAD